MKDFLTAEEITSEINRRKDIRRKKLETKLKKATMNCEVDDVIFVFSSLINQLTR